MLHMEFWMLRKNSNKFVFISIFLISLNCSLFAKGNVGMGDSHPADMLKILGLFTESSDSNSYNNFQKLEPLTSKVNYYIDHYYSEPNGYYHNTETGWKSEKNFKYFAWDWTKYSHRFLNHWGFDMDIDLDAEGAPSSYQYQSLLFELFKERYLNYVGNDDEMAVIEWNRFLKFLKDVQADINDDLIQVVQHYLGIKSYQDARDVAAILYYTHLLGDLAVHEGGDTGKAVLEMNKIKRNLEIHVRNLAKKDLKSFEAYKRDVNSIKAIAEKDYATAYISVLVKDVSKIIQSNFSVQFESKGLLSPENIEF